LDQRTSESSGYPSAEDEWIYDELDQVTELRVYHQGVKAGFAYNERRELIREEWIPLGGSAPPFENVLVDPPAEPLESAPSNEAPGSLSAGGSGFARVLKEYAYDPAGNRRWMRVDGAQTDYAYDAGSRLVTETRPDGAQVSHVYDEWGNEATRTATPPGGPVVTEAYGYNHLNLLAAYVRSEGGVPNSTWQYEYWPTGERAVSKNNFPNSSLSPARRGAVGLGEVILGQPLSISPGTRTSFLDVAFFEQIRPGWRKEQGQARP
jgi:YD repeat-containing protein